MISSELITLLQQSNFFLILFSVFCGAMVGLEREASRKPAGVRTCALVSLGATVFTLMSIHALDFISSTDEFIRYDPVRIASNIVQGVGFLGACCVFTIKDKLSGITTAAAIWVVSAIGMAVGFGHLVLAVQASLLSVIIMFGIGWFEKTFRAKITRRPEYAKRKTSSSMD